MAAVSKLGCRGWGHTVLKIFFQPILFSWVSFNIFSLDTRPIKMVYDLKCLNEGKYIKHNFAHNLSYLCHK